jgi:hypothetical protein
MKPMNSIRAVERRQAAAAKIGATNKRLRDEQTRDECLRADERTKAARRQAAERAG